MGGSAKWFVNIRATQEYYDSLTPEIREGFEITSVYRTDLDYSKYSEHVEQKTKTEPKAYRELKKIEYKIDNLKENK